MPYADKLPLRLVEPAGVRSAAEILAMLDGDASIDGMPFRPKMARYAGRRFTGGGRRTSAAAVPKNLPITSEYNPG
jgi:hypothetical protein